MRAVTRCRWSLSSLTLILIKVQLRCFGVPGDSTITGDQRLAAAAVVTLSTLVLIMTLGALVTYKGYLSLSHLALGTPLVNHYP